MFACFLPGCVCILWCSLRAYTNIAFDWCRMASRRPEKGTQERAEMLEKEKNPWLLGKMFESRFPHASGREEG